MNGFAPAASIVAILLSVTGASAQNPPVSSDTEPESSEGRTVDVTVPANQAWTRTGIVLKEGMEVVITAEGAVNASSPTDQRPYYREVPPDGRRERQKHFPYPLLPGLSMIGRLGYNGPVVWIGSYARFQAVPGVYGTGELLLGINHDRPQANTGSWTAHVLLVNEPSTKASPTRTISSNPPPTTASSASPSSNSTSTSTAVRPPKVTPTASTPPTTPAQPGVKTEGVTLKTDKAVYAPKERIVIHFAGMKVYGGGYITIVKPTDADDHFGTTEGLRDQPEGKWEIADGLAAGSYEARAAFAYGESIQARCRFEVK